MSLHHWDPGVGVSFALSFLIVGVVAVVFHPAHDVAGSQSAETKPKTEPGPTPAQPAGTGGGSIARGDTDTIASAADAFAPRGEASSPGRGLREPSQAPGSATIPSSRIPVTRTSSRRLPPGRRPASPFTDVGQGENLTDVARRVYGTDQAAEALWLANRDRVDQSDTKLPTGTVLRTP